MLKINIGGKIFTTTKDTLTRYGKNKFSEDLDYNKSSYLFFDRDPAYFHLILNHLRGYSIKLPEEYEELYMVYQDVKFYNIISLEKQIEKLLEPTMSQAERKTLIDLLRKKIYEMNIETMKSAATYLEKLNDDELNKIKAKVEIFEKEKKNKLLEQGIFDTCLFVMRFLEKNHGFKNACNRFMQNSFLVKKIITELVANEGVNSKKTELFILFMSVVFEKIMTLPGGTATVQSSQTVTPQLNVAATSGTTVVNHTTANHTTVWGPVKN